MTNQYADSDSNVKPNDWEESEFCSVLGSTLPDMAAKKQPPTSPEPLAEYVRWRIKEWRAAGRDLKELQRLTGIPTTVSHIQGGSSVSEYSGSKLAGPLGHGDFAGLVAAAYEWWNSDRSRIPAGQAPLAEAVDLAVRYSISRAQIDRAIEKVPEEHRGALDVPAWLSRFHAERTLDAQLEADLRAAAYVAANAEKARKEAQSAIRSHGEAAKRRATARPHKAKTG